MDLINHYEHIGRSYKSHYVLYLDIIRSRLPQSGRILDIGCADGKLLLFLKNLGYNAVGLDIAKSFVDRATEFSDCPTYQGTVENMDMFNDDEFDCIISTEVLEHVKSPYQALCEINRILKLDGKTIISTPNSHHLRRILFPNNIVLKDINNRHINCFDLAQWKILFSLGGFKLIWYKGWPDTAIFPRWKGLGKFFDKIFRNKDTLKKYLFYDSKKIKHLNR